MKRYQTQTHTSSLYERRLTVVLLLVFVACWVGFNSLYNAKHVFTNRDPATYTIAAKWLVDNNDINIAKLPARSIDPGMMSDSAGFATSRINNQELNAQGAHLLPALLALPARVLGTDKLIFNTNILLGGIALLALFGMARMVVKSRWALIASLAIGLTLPMMYFSRDTYTEPLSMMFIFGGASLLLMAIQQKDRALWFMAGAVFGASAMARIDAYISIAAIMAFAILYLVTRIPKERVSAVRGTIALIAGLVLTGAVGFLDVALLSSGYFESQWRNIGPELALMSAVILLGAVAVYVSWKTRLIKNLDSVTKGWRGKWAFWALLAFWVALLTRPLWMVAYLHNGSRSYAEYTLYWVGWYIGPVLAVLGLIGVALALKRLLEERTLNVPIALLLALFLSAALLYLNYPSIYPDQVWASRRMLPVILPGFVIFGVYVLQVIYESKPKLNRWLSKVNMTVFVSVLATLSLPAAAVAATPFIFTTSYSQKQAIDEICVKLPRDSNILYLGIAAKESIMATREYCQLPAIGYYYKSQENQFKPTKSALRNFYNAAKSQGERPIIGIYDYNADDLVGGIDNLRYVATISYQNIEPTNVRPPLKMIDYKVDVYFAEIQPDGSLKPIQGLLAP